MRTGGRFDLSRTPAAAGEGSLRARIALLALTLCLACAPSTERASRSGRANAVATPAPTRIAALPRTDVSAADRARWRDVLRWPPECEEGYAVTRVTDDGGLEFHELSPRLSLVLVRCASGAYQPSFVALLLDESADPPRSTLLEFDSFVSEDGKSLVAARTAELSGETAWIARTQDLVVLSLARQIGDCGTWARYALDAGGSRLTAFAERVACPEEPGEGARGPAAIAPEGWTQVPVGK